MAKSKTKEEPVSPLLLQRDLLRDMSVTAKRGVLEDTMKKSLKGLLLLEKEVGLRLTGERGISPESELTQLFELVVQQQFALETIWSLVTQED